MRKIKLISIFFLVSAISVSTVFAGGGNRKGTAGATELLIPVGARGISMGSATLTNSIGIESLFYNPANIARSTFSTNAYFSHMNYFADIGVEYGALSTNLEGFGTVAFSIKALDIGEIPVTTIENPDGTGQTFTPQYLTIGVTYSRLLSDRIAVGVTANYVSEKLDLVSASGFAFNIGISYNNFANVNGLSLAIVMKNLGPQMKFDGSGLYYQANVADFTRPSSYLKLETASFELPSTLELGIGYNYDFNETNSLQFSSVFQNSNFYGDEYKFGAEYSYNNLFFLRGGYAFAPELESDYNAFGLTAGAGINYDVGGVAVKVDYAYRQMEFFEDNHIFAVSLGL
jgi:hypothetical protein